VSKRLCEDCGSDKMDRYFWSPDGSTSGICEECMDEVYSDMEHVIRGMWLPEEEECPPNSKPA